VIREKIQEALLSLKVLLEDEGCLKNIEQAAQWLTSALRLENKILICGNGGSAAEAQHLAGELVGRFSHDHQPLPAIALSTDTSILTAVANDYGFEEIFSRQVRALGRPGDILIGLSTSGASPNVLRAFQEGRKRQMKNILLTGQEPKEVADASDLVIKMPATNVARIQEMHLLLVHLLGEWLENEFSKSS
jgi:D-sedoheptulose 7-phosphate isomerase